MTTLPLTLSLICLPLFLVVAKHFRNLLRAQRLAQGELSTLAASVTTSELPCSTEASTHLRSSKSLVADAIICPPSSTLGRLPRASARTSRGLTLRLIYSANVRLAHFFPLASARVILRARHTRAKQVTLNISVPLTPTGDVAFTGTRRRTLAQIHFVSKSCYAETLRSKPLPILRRTQSAKRGDPLLTSTSSVTLIGE